MFTGIIETIGLIQDIEYNDSNISFWIKSDFHSEVKIDQSIAHNGICLTVDQLGEKKYRVTAIAETIIKTNISNWKIDYQLNLERCLKLGDRLDGHLVQGHIDTTAICKDMIDLNGSHTYTFEINQKYAELIIEKGSITIDGISLTCYNLTEKSFQVSIIPYTFQHTNAKTWYINGNVNIEFDIIGKYLSRKNSIS